MFAPKIRESIVGNRWRRGEHGNRGTANLSGDVAIALLPHRQVMRFKKIRNSFNQGNGWKIPCLNDSNRPVLVRTTDGVSFTRLQIAVSGEWLSVDPPNLQCLAPTVRNSVTLRSIPVAEHQ